MKFRTLGATGLRISEIGVGTWQFGGGLESGVGHGWGGVKDDESIRVIHAAEDLGINFVDTADIYGNGHSETVLGQALRGRRDRWIIATKVGLVKKANEEGQYGDASAQRVIEGVEASLRRLGIDCIDVYQLHSMPTDEQVADTMATLAKLKTQGKVRFYGISTDSLANVRKCRRDGEVHLVQLAFSIANGGKHELLEYCGPENIGVIIRSPFAMGQLTGTYFGGKYHFPDNDQRSRWWANAKMKTLLEHYAPLLDYASQQNCSMVQLALRYVLDRREVSVVIPGIKTVAQLRENAAAGTLSSIPTEIIERMHAVVAIAKQQAETVTQ